MKQPESKLYVRMEALKWAIGVCIIQMFYSNSIKEWLNLNKWVISIEWVESTAPTAKNFSLKSFNHAKLVKILPTKRIGFLIWNFSGNVRSKKFTILCMEFQQITSNCQKLLKLWPIVWWMEKLTKSLDLKLTSIKIYSTN